MASPREPTSGTESTPGARSRVLVIVAEEIAGEELRNAVAERCDDGASEVRVVAPALTETKFQHMAGNVDEAIAAAQQRLERSLAELREAGLHATGRTGDSDLRQAIVDELQDFDADEILLVAHRDDPPPLEREGITEAEHTIEPPITELYVSEGRDGGHVADVERVGRGVTADGDPGEHEPRSRNLPPFGLEDLGGILVAAIGTLALVVLAANCGGDESLNTQGGFGGCELRLLIAGGMGLINLTHIVGLTLFQAGSYRGFWHSFFAQLSLFGTLAAVVVSVLIA